MNKYVQFQLVIFVHFHIVLDKKNEEVKFLEQEDMVTLLNKVKGSTVVSEALMYVALETGARFGEIAALSKSDINIKDSTLSISKNYDYVSKQVDTPKTKTSIRTIKITHELAEFLIKFPSKDAEYIFWNNHHLAPTRESGNKQLKYLIDELGIKNIISFHVLRHTHAGYLLSNDVSIQYVSERLGHANVNVTLSVYAHLFNEKRKIEDLKTISLLQNL
jgi:integrase